MGPLNCTFHTISTEFERLSCCKSAFYRCVDTKVPMEVLAKFNCLQDTPKIPSLPCSLHTERSGRIRTQISFESSNFRQLLLNIRTQADLCGRLWTSVDMKPSSGGGTRTPGHADSARVLLYSLLGEEVSSLVGARRRSPPHPPQRGHPATPLKMSGAVDTLCRLKIGQGAMV